MNVPALFAAEDPALPDPDLEDEEWEDVEVEEMDPAIANQELGEEVIQYEPDDGEMSDDTEPILHEICLIVGTLVIAVCSAMSIYKEIYWLHLIGNLGLLVDGIGFRGLLCRNGCLTLSRHRVIATFVVFPFFFTMLSVLALTLSKGVYPTFFSFSLMAIVGGEISSLWVPMTWAGPLLALSFVSAAKLYDAEDMAEQLAAEDEEDSRHRMDRRRG